MSSDDFDFMEDWISTKENKTIQGAVEWHEESKIIDLTNKINKNGKH